MEDRSTIFPYIIALAAAAALLVYLQRLITVRRDVREPPMLPSGIPVIGHLISLMRKGSDYFVDLDRRFKQSIYLLTVGKGRMYVVSSPGE
jgi:hypothetical protein